MQYQSGSRIMSNETVSHGSFILFLPGIALLFYSLYLSFIYLPTVYFSNSHWQFLLYFAGYAFMSEAFLLQWRHRRRGKSRIKSVLGLGSILFSALLFMIPFTSVPFFFQLTGENYWISIAAAYGLAIGGTFLLRNGGLRHPLQHKRFVALLSILVIPPLVYAVKYSQNIASNGLWGNLSFLGYVALAGAGLVLAIAYLGSPEFYSVAFHTVAITMAYLVWGSLGLMLIPLLFFESYLSLRHAGASPALERQPVSEPVAQPAPQPVPVPIAVAAEPARASSRSSAELVQPPSPSLQPEPSKPASKKTRRNGINDGKAHRKSKLAAKITSKLTGKNRACPACGAANPVTNTKCDKCGAALPDDGTVLY
jgi:ribosomal protein L40E